MKFCSDLQVVNSFIDFYTRKCCSILNLEKLSFYGTDDDINRNGNYWKLPANSSTNIHTNTPTHTRARTHAHPNSQKLGCVTQRIKVLNMAKKREIIDRIRIEELTAIESGYSHSSSSPSLFAHFWPSECYIKNSAFQINESWYYTSLYFDNNLTKRRCLMASNIHSSHCNSIDNSVTSQSNNLRVFFFPNDFMLSKFSNQLRTGWLDRKEEEKKMMEKNAC